MGTTANEEVQSLNGKECFLASASFSSAVPRSEGLGNTEFRRSTFVTFYYRTMDPKVVRNPQGVEVRKEYYGYYITRCLKSLEEAAEFRSSQFEEHGSRMIFRERPARYSFEEGDAQDTVLQEYNTRAVERREIYHQRNFKSALRDSKLQKQVEHMLSKPYYFC